MSGNCFFGDDPQPTETSASGAGQTISKSVTQPQDVKLGSAEHQRVVQFLASHRLRDMKPGTAGDFHVIYNHKQQTPAVTRHKPFKMPPPPYDLGSSDLSNVGDTLSIATCSDGMRQAWIFVYEAAEAPHSHDPAQWQITDFTMHTQDCAAQK